MIMQTTMNKKKFLQIKISAYKWKKINVIKKKKKIGAEFGKNNSR